MTLGWAPEGTRRRGDGHSTGRDKEERRRFIRERLKSAGMASWKKAAAVGKDQEQWRGVAENVPEAPWSRQCHPATYVN